MTCFFTFYFSDCDRQAIWSHWKYVLKIGMYSSGGTVLESQPYSCVHWTDYSTHPEWFAHITPRWLLVLKIWYLRIRLIWRDASALILFLYLCICFMFKDFICRYLSDIQSFVFIPCVVGVILKKYLTAMWCLIFQLTKGICLDYYCVFWFQSFS